MTSRVRSTTPDTATFAKAIYTGSPFVASVALAQGIVTRYDLNTRFRTILPGIHVLAKTDPRPEQLVRAAGLWARPNGILAGYAAAMLHGERWLSHEEVCTHIDVYLPGSPSTPSGMRLRTRPQRFPQRHMTVVDGIFCTSVERTAIDLLRWEHDAERAVMAVDSLCNATKTMPLSASAFAGEMRPAHGARRALELLPQCDPRADSPQETRLRLYIADSPLPKPTPQLRISDRRGRHIATADLGYELLRVALFYDGGDHLAREQRDWDSSVNAALGEIGWRTLRITAGMLKRKQRLLRQIADLLSRQGWDGSESTP